ncbi:MAG: hypothetical protein PHV17_02560 [Candidatus Omnitrophica bacterium]|nr:hypothetical protein [Candidatus Omnitrophota bacterium]
MVKIKHNLLLNRAAVAAAAVSALILLRLATGNILYSQHFFWNAMRAAWVLSPFYGYSFYFLPAEAPVLSVIYGPIGALLLSPIALAKTPGSIVTFGSFLCFCYYLFPVIALFLSKKNLSLRQCFFWFCGLSFFLIFTLSIPAMRHCAFAIHVDAPGLALVVSGCLLIGGIKSSKSETIIFLSSLCLVLSFWDKQTFVPVLFVVLAYLFCFIDKKIAYSYMTFLLVNFILVSGIILLFFPVKSLLFYIFELPAKTPWKDIREAQNLLPFLQYTAGFGLFIIILSKYYVFFAQKKIKPETADIKIKLDNSRWLLFALIGISLYFTGVLGYIKWFGSENNFGISFYFLAISCLLIFVEFAEDRFWSLTPENKVYFFSGLSLLVLWLTLIVVFLFQQRVFKANPSSKSGLVAAYSFSKKYPGQVYLPDFPLVTLLTDSKLYYFTFAIKERQKAKYPFGRKNLNKYIPQDLKFIVFDKKSFANGWVNNFFPEFVVDSNFSGLSPRWIVLRPKENIFQEKNP